MMEVDYEVGMDDMRDLIRRVITQGKQMAPLAEATTPQGADTTAMDADEAMAFWAVSLFVALLMRTYSLRARNGTCFRLAVGLMDELREAEHCSRCLGQKIVNGKTCSTCGGSGRFPMSTSWRADRTMSHYVDFRDRIEPVYVRMLAHLTRVVGL